MVDLSRLEYLVGKEELNKLKNKSVLVCGLGGVGSFTAEALARSGVGSLDILDYDKIDSSNLNRQLMTSKNNVGQSKALVLKKRLEEISDCNVETIESFIDSDFKFNKKYDYVVDCIDTLTSKFYLVKLAHQNNIPIISALGSANRLVPVNIKHTTLDKTQNDPLAKAFRNLVKKENYRQKIDVVYVDTKAIKSNIIKEGKTNKEKYPLGSSIFVTGSVGLYIAAIVFQNLLKKD